MIDKVFNNLVSRAEQNFQPRPTDYVGDDGLLRCGVCQEKLQHRINVDKIIEDTERAFGRPLTEKEKEDRRAMFGRVVRCVCRCSREDRAAYERRQAEREIEEKRKFCFLGNCYYYAMQFKFDDNSNQDATRLGMNFVDKFSDIKKNGRGLVLTGGSGHGKTFLSCEIANAIIDRGGTVRFTSLSELYGMCVPGVSLSMIISGLTECDLVVIDDLSINEKNEGIAFDLINALYTHQIPTIVTTNMTVKKLQAFERIYSRMVDRWVFKEIKNEKGDRRAAAKSWSKSTNAYGQKDEVNQ